MQNNLSFFKAIAKLLTIIIRIVYLIVALILIFYVNYYFGKGLLGGLWGGDTSYNLAVVHWFDHWYPQIPLWYPLQGGGVSLLYGYHFLAHVFTVMLSRLYGITLENAYQILCFSSVLLSALGIYFFVWTRFNNQTVALISSIFYFLSPISWAWLYTWGFYGESIAYIFIIPSILFYDSFLTSVLDKKFNLKARLSLLFGTISLTLLLFTHALAFLGMVTFFPFYAILYPLISSKRARFKQVVVGFTATVIFLACAYLLSAFQEINFQYYSSISNRAGASSKEFLLKDASDWELKPFLNLETYIPKQRRFAEKNISFAVPIWIFAGLGLVTSFWISRKLFVIGLYSALSFLFMFHYEPVWWFLNLSGAQHYRPLVVPLRFFIPILAAFGIYSIPKLVFWILFLWKKYLGKRIKIVLTFIQSILVAIATLALAYAFIMLFRYYSYFNPPFARYGPDMVSFKLIADYSWPYLCHKGEWLPSVCSLEKKEIVDKKEVNKICFIMNTNSQKVPPFCYKTLTPEVLTEIKADCKKEPVSNEIKPFCTAIVNSIYEELGIGKWPDLKVKALLSIYTDPIDNLTQIIKKDNNKPVRIDVSPNLGQVTQGYNLKNFSDSMINLWGYQSSLNHSYWGYEQATFYSKNTNPTRMFNVAQWFGTNYILLNKEADPIVNFTNDRKNWQSLNKENTIFKFSKDLDLFSYSDKKPAALIIGSKEKTAYETFFKLANDGIVGYDNAFLISGSKNVDDYKLDELKKFKLLILLGYSYKNRNHAFDLLDKYLRQGGRIFLSTGWQYNDKDWEIEKAPAFFPVDNLVWNSKMDMKATFETPDQKISANVKEFSPLSWESQPWGISTTDSLKPWAKIYLEASDKPLVVGGEYNSGKIIWSGINLIGHIAAFNNNQEEINFLHQIFMYLLDYGNFTNEDETKDILLKRDSPDKIEFIFNKNSSGGAFYLRESYHPDWKANFDSGTSKQNLKIYKAGPLYKLVILPPVSKGSKLTFEYTNGIRGIIANLISILTLILLLVYVAFAKSLLSGLKKIISPFMLRLKSFGKKHATKFKLDSRSEEKEY